MPSIVSAATTALIMASSTAWTVASNNGLIKSLGNSSTFVKYFLSKADGLVVENAMNISPEPFSPRLPIIPTPSGTLVAIFLIDEAIKMHLSQLQL